MRKLAVVVAIMALASVAGAAKKKVAVPRMKASGSDIESMASPLTEILTTELESLVDVEVIGSSDISALIGFEKEKELLGCDDDVTCIAQIGGALGVDLLLVSEVGRVGSTYVLNLKLIDSHKGTVLKRGYRSVPSADGLIDAVKPALAVVVPLLSSTGATQPAAATADPEPTPEPEPEPTPEPDQTAATEPVGVEAMKLPRQAADPYVLQVSLGPRHEYDPVYYAPSPDACSIMAFRVLVLRYANHDNLVVEELEYAGSSCREMKVRTSYTINGVRLGYVLGEGSRFARDLSISGWESWDSCVIESL